MKNFNELLKEWLFYMKAQVKPSTFACYERLASTHIEPFFENVMIEDMNQSLVSSFITQMLSGGRVDGQGGLSEKTVKDMMSIVNSVFKYSEIIYGIKRPALFKWRYANNSKPIDVFSEKEQMILEKYLVQDMTPQKLGILICLYSGMRLGEICSLQWSDVDLNQRVFHVRRTVQRIYNRENSHSTEIIIGTPKTQSAIRDIPITSRLWGLLYAWQHMQEADNCLVSGRYKAFMDPRTYQIKYKGFLEGCGLRYRNFHALRHTFATRCIEKDIDIKSLSEILGHSSVNITLNRYVHSSMEQKRSQLEKLCHNGQ